VPGSYEYTIKNGGPGGPDKAPAPFEAVDCGV
jgi:hypothetical protein